ncbi:hypothetical protein PVT71_05110 [Salipiger sp. H15]|uniref:Uncharacterized protein n=1 Tax=Alloyangia sp. H15 TaxID=3029062 RepID=A0AAU8AI20_9RHOB
MERIPEYGLSSWQVRSVGNGVHLPDMAQALALVDAGIGAGVFGYDLAEPRDAARFETLDDARLESLYAEDMLSQEQASLAQGRKSKLALLRGESDGSVRGLRNAVISLGHWHDMDHAPGGTVAAPDTGGYAESWRIGWAELLPEIMQLSVDGPLEAMGHVPLRQPIPDPFHGGLSAVATDVTGPDLTEEGRAFLARMLAGEEEDAADSFVFGAPDDWHAAEQAQGGAYAPDGHHAQEELLFVESQYAALHGALFDGDAAWDGQDGMAGDAGLAEEGFSHSHRPGTHDHEGHGAFGDGLFA